MWSDIAYDVNGPVIKPLAVDRLMAYRVDYVSVEALVSLDGLERLIRQLLEQLKVVGSVLDQN